MQLGAILGRPVGRRSNHSPPLPLRRSVDSALRSAVSRHVRGGLSRVLWDVVARMSPRTRVTGIELCGDSEEDGSTELFFARMRLVLDLIDRYDPLRMARIRRDLRRIMLVPDGGGWYERGPRTHLVGLPAFATKSVEENACEVVHEATHARIGKAGIPYTGAWRRRIETLCVAQEIAFAERLPPGDWSPPTAEALTTPWWSADESHQRTLTTLRALEVPSWMVRFFQWQFGRWRRSHPEADRTD
jgi:hypothetical protein